MMNISRIYAPLALSASLATVACGGPDYALDQDVQGLNALSAEVFDGDKQMADAYLAAESADPVQDAMRAETPPEKSTPTPKGEAPDGDVAPEPISGCVDGIVDGHWSVLVRERMVVFRAEMVTVDGREVGSAVARVTTDAEGNRVVSGKIVDQDGATLGRVEGRWMGVSDTSPRTAQARQMNDDEAPTNEYRKGPTSDTVEDEETMEIIGHFIARWYIDDDLNGTLRGHYLKGSSDLEGLISGGFATDCGSN
jgi:hypothetical protein